MYYKYKDTTARILGTLNNGATWCEYNNSRCTGFFDKTKSWVEISKWEYEQQDSEAYYTFFEIEPEEARIALDKEPGLPYMWYEYREDLIELSQKKEMHNVHITVKGVGTAYKDTWKCLAINGRVYD